MKVFEVKKMICPINSKPCIVNLCPKWKYTKIVDIEQYIPEASCKCGNQKDPYTLCWSCGDVATPENRLRGMSEYGTDDELPDDDKEGVCTL